MEHATLAPDQLVPLASQTYLELLVDDRACQQGGNEDIVDVVHHHRPWRGLVLWQAWPLIFPIHRRWDDTSCQIDKCWKEVDHVEQPLMSSPWLFQKRTVDEPWNASSAFVNGVLEPLQGVIWVVSTLRCLDESCSIVRNEHNHRIFIPEIIWWKGHQRRQKLSLNETNIYLPEFFKAVTSFPTPWFISQTFISFMKI